MDRRDFIKTTGTLMAGVALGARAFAAAAGHTAPASRILPINRGWKFLPKVPPDGHDAGFDEAAMTRVVVPHSNKSLPWHSFDDAEYEFVSLYRRKFRLPASAKGKRIFVDFEGAMVATTVWINGKRLGEYKGGYTPFSFELTDHVTFDGENILALDVDSTERPDVPPFGHQIDYLTFGGLYREVALRIVPANFHRQSVRRACRRAEAPGPQGAVLCRTSGKSWHAYARSAARRRRQTGRQSSGAGRHRQRNGRQLRRAAGRKAMGPRSSDFVHGSGAPHRRADA
jgi:hypothetical protein